mmetsp:Transcript_4028/g.2982  ORF Transcript_4028/g.2982 Transcript_4028/m.2982 type:complete len:90 (+) Transcript_4028:267-536(+)
MPLDSLYSLIMLTGVSSFFGANIYLAVRDCVAEFGPDTNNNSLSGTWIDELKQWAERSRGELRHWEWAILEYFTHVALIGGALLHNIDF